MPGIDPDIICHKLSIREGAKPVKQKARRINAERSQALQEEVDRLLKAGFIRGPLPGVVSQPGLGKEEEWEVACMH